MKLLKFQQKVEAIKKDSKNPFFKSNYFDINSLLKEIKPILNELELTLIQPLTTIEGRPALRTILLDGEKELVNDLVILPDLQDPQKMGSAITYYRRYSIQSLLLLQAEDDDGNMASSNSSIDDGKKSAMEDGMKKAKIAKWLNGIALEINGKQLENPEDFKKLCLDQTKLELIPENYDKIIKFIN